VSVILTSFANGSSSVFNLFYVRRYAEIVNVKLGNGQTRKGQVLEICGKKAVV
jgi:vacuolar-type H+-ATPase subunit B/Vma2